MTKNRRTINTTPFCTELTSRCCDDGFTLHFLSDAHKVSVHLHTADIRMLGRLLNKQAQHVSEQLTAAQQALKGEA